MLNQEYLYFHFNITDSKSIVNSLRLPVEITKTTISELKEIAEKGINSSSQNIKYKVQSISKHQNSKSLDDFLMTSLLFDSTDDVFITVKIEKTIPVEPKKVEVKPEVKQEVKVEPKEFKNEVSNDGKLENPKPNTTETKKNDKKDEVEEEEEGIKLSDVKPSISSNINLISKVDDLHFKVLERYTFYDADDNYVKIQVKIPRANEIPTDNIITEFAVRSLLIRVVDFEGSNYKFGVPQLNSFIDPQGCKVLPKKDYLLVKLKKLRSGDRWGELHRIKGIGDDM